MGAIVVVVCVVVVVVVVVAVVVIVAAIVVTDMEDAALVYEVHSSMPSLSLLT
jgi:hypothetical protein